MAVLESDYLIIRHQGSRAVPRSNRDRSSPTGQMSALVPTTTHPRVPPFPELPLPLPRSFVMDYVWQHHQQTVGVPFSPYALPWMAKRTILFPGEFSEPFHGNPIFLFPRFPSFDTGRAVCPSLESRSSTVGVINKERLSVRELSTRDLFFVFG